jgi:hypothetical protein
MTSDPDFHCVRGAALACFANAAHAMILQCLRAISRLFASAALLALESRLPCLYSDSRKQHDGRGGADEIVWQRDFRESRSASYSRRSIVLALLLVGLLVLSE